MISANSSSLPSKNSTSERCVLTDTQSWVPTYILIICALGIVGNVFVLVVFCFHKKACTVAEIYLSNLAAADLVLVSFLPFWAAYVSQDYNWTLGKSMCRLVNAGIKITSYCSIYFLVLVSIDRYLALVHPLSNNRLRRPKCAKLSCVMVWGLGLLMSVPTFIQRDLKIMSNNSTICSLNYESKTTYMVCYILLPIIISFIIPVPIITYCTVKIVQALRNRSKERISTVKLEHKATTLVLVVLTAFLICWMPYDLMKIIKLLGHFQVLSGCTFLKTQDICSQLFAYWAYFNSVLNPILYVIVGENFRKKAVELGHSWASKRTLSLSQTGTSLTTQQSDMKITPRRGSGRGMLTEQSP